MTTIKVKTLFGGVVLIPFGNISSVNERINGFANIYLKDRVHPIETAHEIEEIEQLMNQCKNLNN